MNKISFLVSTTLLMGFLTTTYADKLSVKMGTNGIDVSVDGLKVELNNNDTDSTDEEAPSSSSNDGDESESYVNADLNGKDFSNQSLIGADFSNADLTKVNFRGANLSGVNFSNATFIHCDLRGAIVDGANFTNVDFGSTKISGVDFSRANMTNVDIGRVNIKESASLSSNNILIILTKKSNKPPQVNLDVRFAHDSDRVEAHSMKQIIDLSKALNSKDLQKKSIIIEGHTDSDGANDYNLDLSQRRANSVIKLLVGTYGIATSRLTAKGYGEEKPVYSNKSAFGKSINRRVTVVLPNG